MSAHTPAPWRIEAHTAESPEQISHSCDWTIFGADGNSVCIEPFQSNKCAAANARLIAAAPELLAALEAILTDLELRADFKFGLDKGVLEVSDGIYQQAREAIAKAKGG